jgi:lysophospholipase L1-like esterase
MRLKALVLLSLAIGLTAGAATYETKPNDPFFDKYHPLKAPAPAGLALKPGDRLAICGDSITQQRRYSRIIETYLTVCEPDLNISVRQYGWNGEKASGFLARMTNDCLRFQPTIATTCYGMNDHLYRAYRDDIGASYRSNMTAVVEAFKAHGARVILGSAGCVGKPPTWTGDRNATTEDLNLNLCQLRNIDIDIAKREQVRFADVFWPMFTAGHEAQQQYGTNYTMSGRDGVHPDWAGHVVMAYAFLHALGLKGDLGTFTVDLRANTAKVSAGHELLGFKDGELQVESHRYPFCIGEGDLSRQTNLCSGAAFVPFDRELNRFMLVVRHAKAKSYKITWGDETRSFTAKQLEQGVNLAAEFPVNPFSDAFKRVDEAVAAKQAYETTEIQKGFRSAEAKADMEGAVAKCEAARAPLVDAVKAAFVPVTHTIKIEAE